jgi:ABC-type sugar transport system ATPase subunit
LNAGFNIKDWSGEEIAADLTEALATALMRVSTVKTESSNYFLHPNGYSLIKEASSIAGFDPNAFVAGFIGSPAMNLLNVPVSGGKAKLGGFSVDVPASAGALVTVGVRPEGFTPASSGGFDVLVEVVEELGSDAFIYGKPVDKSIKFAQETDEGAQVIVRWDPKNPPKPGATISVNAIASAVHLFDANSGLRIN